MVNIIVCTLHIIHFTLYILHYTFQSLYHTSHIPKFTLYITLYNFWIINCWVKFSLLPQQKPVNPQQFLLYNSHHTKKNLNCIGNNAINSAVQSKWANKFIIANLFKILKASSDWFTTFFRHNKTFEVVIMAEKVQFMIFKERYFRPELLFLCRFPRYQPDQFSQLEMSEMGG